MQSHQSLLAETSLFTQCSYGLCIAFCVARRVRQGARPSAFHGAPSVREPIRVHSVTGRKDGALQYKGGDGAQGRAPDAHQDSEGRASSRTQSSVVRVYAGPPTRLREVCPGWPLQTQQSQPPRSEHSGGGPLQPGSLPAQSCKAPLTPPPFPSSRPGHSSVRTWSPAEYILFVPLAGLKV